MTSRCVTPWTGLGYTDACGLADLKKKKHSQLSPKQRSMYDLNVSRFGIAVEIYPWRTMSFHDISMVLFPWCIQVASNCHRPERCFVFLLVASSAWKANPIAKPIRKEHQKNWALGENRRNILGLFQACRLWLQSPENRGRNRLKIVCRDKNKMTNPVLFCSWRVFWGPAKNFKRYRQKHWLLHMSKS